MKILDDFLNTITMYRLVVYELFLMLILGGILAFFGLMTFSPFYLLYSGLFIYLVSWGVNAVFSRAFRAPSNPESVLITGLILTLIITPPQGMVDWHYLPLAFWAAASAMASKYIITVRKKHIFNPAAFGVVATSLLLGLTASWWVGTPALVPIVLLSGLLMVRKIRRFDLWAAFIAVVLGGTLYEIFNTAQALLRALSYGFLYSPAFFFATIMLTEPATTPPQKLLRILYGSLVGILFLPHVHIGPYYFSPEMALLAGNVFAFIVSPKYKLRLVLKESVKLTKDVYEFVFHLDRHFAFAPGQYMEWTLPHKNPDTRSIRRYFTIASSPTEREVRLGVKFYEPGSSFKKALRSIEEGSTIIAGQLSGEFTLPKDKSKKLVFIAGGIGSTPFRSMVKYLLDKQEHRDIVFFYSNRSPEDAAYKDIFDHGKEAGVRTIYAYPEVKEILPIGAIPGIDRDAIVAYAPDYRERVFYISGPKRMVEAFEKLLEEIGIHRSHIKTDYFPGF